AFAGLTVALLTVMTATWLQRVDLGLLAGCSVLGSVTVWRQAVWAEVYIGQAFFFVLALWLLLRARKTVAGWAAPGLALAGSVLFSPSTLLGVPGLLVARPRWRSLLGLGLAGGGIVLGVLAFVWRDYFLGPRGLFGADATSGGPIQAVIKEGVEVVFGVGALLPFAALGAWAFVRSRRGRLGLAVLATMWAPTFLFGERYPDVPVQLPTWLLLAPVLACGVAFLEDRLDGEGWGRRSVWLGPATLLASLPFLAIPFIASRSQSFAALETGFVATLLTGVWVSGALAAWLSGERPRVALRVVFVLWTACGLALSVRLVQDQNVGFEAYRSEVLALKAAAAVDYVAIGSWEQGILLEHYIYGRPYTGHTLNLDEWRRGEPEAVQRLQQALIQEREVWLLRSDPALESLLTEAGRTGRPFGPFLVYSPGAAPVGAKAGALEPS
ncbi:MAG: hypothetical protein AAFY88_16035, partial [Acidobacteriota bacterium]